MVQKFKEYLSTHYPQLKEQKLLLAFSGGVDSSVLLDLCLSVGLRPTIAHCNFQLRGSESATDAEWVQTLSKEKDLACFIQSFETKKHATREKISVQMAARNLRYAWFETLCEQEGFTAVLVGHHADDSVETFLINAFRGSGLKGLLGIPETRGKIVRPLLPFSKAEIEAHAAAQSLQWREDSSNVTKDYLRNALRHEVMPQLNAYQPNSLSNIITTLGHLNAANRFMDQSIAALKKKLFQADHKDFRISIAALEELSPLNFCLHELFTPYGFSAKEVKKLLTATSGKILLSSSHRLLRDREFFILSLLKEETAQVIIIDLDAPNQKLPIDLHWDYFRELPKKTWNTNEAALDKKLLKNPLLLRKSKVGDYFYPTGMKGKKLLSKYYKDEKYSLRDKENQWLLCSDTAIVWVVGKRCDRRFTTTEKTAETLLITYVL